MRSETVVDEELVEMAMKWAKPCQVAAFDPDSRVLDLFSDAGTPRCTAGRTTGTPATSEPTSLVSTLLRAEIGNFAVGRQVEAVNPASVLGHERVVGNPRHRLTAPFQRT